MDLLFSTFVTSSHVSKKPVRKLNGFSADMHAVAEKMWKEELAKGTKPTGTKTRRPEETWRQRVDVSDHLVFHEEALRVCLVCPFRKGLYLWYGPLPGCQ